MPAASYHEAVPVHVHLSIRELFQITLATGVHGGILPPEAFQTKIQAVSTEGQSNESVQLL